MSSQIFPQLPGISGLEVTRNYRWKTAVQEAISGKMTAVSLRQYPLVHYELIINLMRNNQTPSELLELQGLYNSLKGRGDTFLYSDPDFNTVALMPFAVTDAVTTAFQTTATNQNAGGPGGAELIQNLNGAPTYFLNRFGTLNEPLLAGTRALPILWNGDPTNAAWTKANLTAAFSGGGMSTVGGTSVLVASLTETTATGSHVIIETVACTALTGVDFTFSAMVFPGLRTWVALVMQESLGSQTATCFFNIATGAIGTSTPSANLSNLRVSIAPLNNGSNGYKCSITATKNSAATGISCFVQGATADTINSYAGNSASTSFLAWGMQFEEASFAGATVPTTSSVITQADYTLGPTGIITLPSALTTGLPLKWSGSFYYRCRFDEDEIAWTKFMTTGLWMVKKLAFTSVKL